MNDLLRRAFDDAQLSPQAVAKHLGVDPKTVHRWLSGRMPYPRHRASLARLLDRDEHDLWPTLALNHPASDRPNPEVLALYPHRWAVPRTVWQRLFESAEYEIGILVYAGLFLAEDTGILRTLTKKAQDGVPIRILLGDPDSPTVAARGADEGLDDAMAAKIRNSLVLYKALHNTLGIEIRLHRTPLYASIYRADDDLLINPHIYGVPASNAPVLHIRRTEDGDMTPTYLNSFERIWTNAIPLL